MKNIIKSFKQIAVVFSALTISTISFAQSYSTQEPVFRDASGNIYKPSNGPITIPGGTTLYPVYPMYENNVVQVQPQYGVAPTYPTPMYQAPVYPPQYQYAPQPYNPPIVSYRQPMYTSEIVYDVAPWILLGGAAIALSNSNRHHYHGYHRPPRMHYGRGYRR